MLFAMAMEGPRRKSAKGVVLTPSSSSSSCPITNLPDPILMEILCSLPIKALATSKSVCKSWLHLIRDPQFSQLHQARAPTELCFQQLYESNTTNLYMGNFNFLSNFDPLDAKLDTLLELPKFTVGFKNVLNYSAGRQYLRFANSCIGLLCYYGQYENRFAVVWNPCSSEFITFRAPYKHKGHPCCFGYGLGFSRKANKFKLLRLRGRKYVGPYAVEVVGEMCTIEKGCTWKNVGKVPVDFPWYPMILSSGTFLQGALHWAIVANDLSEITILTFNFEDDQFGRIQLPPHFAKPLRSTRTRLSREKLGVLGGCLFITEHTNEGVSVWLLKEYGVQASWTILFSFGYPSSRTCLPTCLPITNTDNGEILMTTDMKSSEVFFYNPALERVRVIGSCPTNLKLTAFKPSLVLLKDSMLGYDVHVVKPRSPDLRHREMSTTPVWWKPVKEERLQLLSVAEAEENISAT